MALSPSPLIIPGNDPAERRRIQRMAVAGRVTRIFDGLYIDPKGRPLAEVVCGAWAPILAHFIPGSVLNGRSALRKAAYRDRGPDGRPGFPGWVFATDPSGGSRKSYSMPGLEIRSVPGPGPLEGDIQYLGVYLPSDARALLENLMISRARQGPSRTAGREDVEAEVERLLKTLREDGLQEMRAHATRIAPSLGAEKELATLQDIVGTILGSREAKLASPQVAARRRSVDPYDPDCMERLKLLATTLNRVSIQERPDVHVGPDVRSCTSFIEAYFTNYIEGTRFLVAKAKRIVFDQEDPDGRPQDGRDVTQTFAQVASLGVGASLASTVGEFIDEIRERNRQLLDSRPDKQPGQFKIEPNMAGNTVFVMPELVEGTLREGFAMLQSLDKPVSRGLFTHAMLALVHPFNDGNGRTSRIMMTKELVLGGQSRIIVPTIYRSDYIGGLRALSRDGAANAGPFISSMLRCQGITAKIASESLDETIQLWASTHAFLEDEHGAKLTEPGSQIEIEWRNGIPAPTSYWADLDMQAQLDADGDADTAFRL